MSEPKTHGDALREGRERLGLSLRALAEKLNVSHGYIFDVEDGRRTASEELLRRWRVAVWPEPWTSELQESAVLTALERHPDGATVAQINRTTGGMSEENINATLKRLIRGGRIERVAVYRVKETK